MIQVISSRDTASNIAQSAAFVQPLANETPQDVELRLIEHNFRLLTDLCVEAMTKAVRCYQVEDLWSIGSMPGCTVMSDQLEQQITSYVSHPQVTSSHFERANELRKGVGDLRCVVRGTRQAAQLAWLFQQEEIGTQTIPIIRSVAEAAQTVVYKAADAVEHKSVKDTRLAARLHLLLEEERLRAEQKINSSVAHIRFSPTVLRLTRGAVLNLIVATDGMVRATARFVTAS